MTKAYLVGVYFSTNEKKKAESHLKELEALASTYGVEVVKALLCHLRQIDPATFLGSGKINEIAIDAEIFDADVIIFDEEIAPQQVRNLEKICKCSVMDRTELILGVFAKRAFTKEAKLQIDLARFQYELPRLKRMWTHLSRQRTGGAGGGYLKGEGEKQIEIDKRIIKKKITFLMKEIQEVKKQRDLQRQKREKASIPTFAIVGYTNAGKSTLFNALTEAHVLVEDKLFATLDPTARQIVLPNKEKAILIDTVGFIRKLPHTLIAAFKSTLEEASFADVLIHVVDASSGEAIEQIEATLEVLDELNALKRPIITCLNKIDQADSLIKLKIKCPKSVEISALKKEGFTALFELMEKEISKLRKVVNLRIPQSEYKIITKVMKNGKILSLEYEENDILVTAEVPLYFKL